MRFASDQVPLRQSLAERDAAVLLLESGAEASMVVVGTHHYATLAGALQRSVGRSLLAASPVPVCVVPPDWDDEVAP